MMASASSSRKPLVLIVEDEFLLRMDAMQMIEEAGFDVLEAATADQAIALLEQRSDIAVIFTDIDLPGSMNGLKLAHAVRDRWPPIRIVTTSGHFNLDQDKLPSGCKFIPKPYDFRHVAETIRDLMGMLTAVRLNPHMTYSATESVAAFRHRTA